MILTLNFKSAWWEWTNVVSKKKSERSNVITPSGKAWERVLQTTEVASPTSVSTSHETQLEPQQWIPTTIGGKIDNQLEQDFGEFVTQNLKRT